jgi:hypothetical protein
VNESRRIMMRMRYRKRRGYYRDTRSWTPNVLLLNMFGRKERKRFRGIVCRGKHT